MPFNCETDINECQELREIWLILETMAVNDSNGPRQRLKALDSVNSNSVKLLIDAVINREKSNLATVGSLSGGPRGGSKRTEMERGN